MRVLLSLSLVLLSLLPCAVYGTHLRAADIIVEQQCNSLTYKITLRVYMNSLSQTMFGGATVDDGHIDFGDGSPLHLIPETPYTLRPELGPEIGVATYSVTHTYARAGEYKVNYFERDRSAGVLNIPNSHDVPYSTYVIINAQSSLCNNFPILQVAPVDRACRGVAFFHNPGAVDIDGDSLSYELSIPQQNSQQTALGYVSPADRIFYTNFEKGNEAGNGPPIFSIDAETGLLTWDAPGISGEYNIAFTIVEWRLDQVTGLYFKLSTTVRDMQIVVEDCANKRPTLNIPVDICVEAGTVITGTFSGTDPDKHPVKIEVISTIFAGESEMFPATYDPVFTDFQPSDPPLTVNFEWKTNCIHVRDQAYQVVIKITDNPPRGPKIVTFKTWNIRVIAPAPVWKNVTVDLVQRTASLEWEDYSCVNASKIQLWRKVGSTPFVPGPCTAGLSIHKGYTLIAELDPSVTSYVDSGNGAKLVVGAQYCYRLVAIFQNPVGRSYVSDESCVGPILADAPVITNVSVLKTSAEEGRVEVKWTKPFDISATQFPEPYQYEVYRGNGFTPVDAPVNVSGRISAATSFIDSTADTENNVYNYQVVLYSKTQDFDEYSPIDTSEIASTVRLSVTPGAGQFLLKWEAKVPWSNVTSERPYHRIYRGTSEDGDNDLTLIDSVEVSEFGFEYIDVGRYQNEPIREDGYYCYSIETIGTYGNSRIPIMFNRSQMVCSYPVNDLPPCAPQLILKHTDCEQFLRETNCDENTYYNELSWTIPDSGGCRIDVVGIKIYSAMAQDGEYDSLIVPASPNGFQHAVSSLARCYKIAAIDTKGIQSALSNVDCNESCPFYQLPNVFTPNADGCNDLFSAYLYDRVVPISICPDADLTRCPRFVRNVSFKVLNRWGRIVYEYRSDDAHSVNIDWNGRDKDGKLLDSGVYYYVADVEFETIDPSLRHKKLKGSVQIVL